MKNLLFVLAVTGVLASVSANFCFVCNSREDPNCLLPDGTVLMRDCNTANNNTCFTRIVNREVERGCSASLSVLDFSNCNADNNCHLCHDVANQGRCNGLIFPEHRLHCHQCVGAANSTCGEEIVTTPQLCRFFDAGDQCFISVVAGQVERGCLSQSDVCRIEQSCTLCDGHGCNFRHHTDGAMSMMVSIRTIVMALVAAMAYGSFKQ